MVTAPARIEAISLLPFHSDELREDIAGNDDKGC
jgi:hypothetical protein